MTDRDLKIVSFDGTAINDGTTYTAGLATGDEWGLPRVKPRVIKRQGLWPVLSGVDRPGRKITLFVRVEASTKRTSRDALTRLFDPEDETPKELIVEDEDGTGDRYVNAICESFEPLRIGGYASLDTFIARLAVHGDVRWRSTSEDSDVWTITGTGDTENITNDGTDDAYPILEIEPTSSKSGGYAHKRFAAVVWKSERGATNYPIRIGPFDTTGCLANGDDIRVFVNGGEYERWFKDVQTANTYLWVTLDFGEAKTGALLTPIAASGSISTIDLRAWDETEADNLNNWPTEGLVLIDSEVFSYGARDQVTRSLTNVTRAVKNTSMAAHVLDDDVHLLQHDVTIVYENSAITDPPIGQDDNYQPAFDLDTSTNDMWDWNGGSSPYMGEPDMKRVAQWINIGRLSTAGTGGCYTQAQRTISDPWFELLGLWRSESNTGYYAWYFTSPVGIVNSRWTAGESREGPSDEWNVDLMRDPWGYGQWFKFHDVTAPTAAYPSWDTWSKAKDLTDWDRCQGVIMVSFNVPCDVGVEQIEIWFDTDYSPDVTLCAEDGNYSLDATITNNTTGEAITVKADMGTSETLIVNCDDATVVHDEEGTNEYQTVEVAGAPRRHWLRLQPGVNQLQFDDTGTVGVTITVKHEPRYY